MNAPLCTECGASVDPNAERCERCGAQLEPRRLHEGSDVRIEPERIDAALPSELAPASGRWGRVSDHPQADSEAAPLTLSDRPHKNPEELFESSATQVEQNEQGQVHAAHPPTDSAVAVDASPPLRPIAPLLEPRAATTSGAHPTQPRRPPVLASEALLRDLAPSRPARSALRIWCPLLGVLGATGAWLLTGGHGLGWPLTGAFASLALLGLSPMPYQGRASAVSTVAGTGLALVLWADAQTRGGSTAIMLAASVTLLAMGLFFRGWHRASILARFIVATGVLLGGCALWLSGELAHLTLFDTDWQSWLPRLVGLGFGLLLMFSLLAFMDSRTTGGAGVWATLVLLWHAVHAAVAIALTAWPKSEAQFDLARVPLDSLLAWSSAPPLTALLALGLSQLLAAGLADSDAGPGHRRSHSSLPAPPGPNTSPRLI
jgi:hypothetical protein